jgi:hypothetical protein
MLFTKEKGGEGVLREFNGAGDYDQSVCIYGNITMKPFCIKCVDWAVITSIFIYNHIHFLKFSETIDCCYSMYRGNSYNSSI